jgi:chromosome partitioning protein
VDAFGDKVMQTAIARTVKFPDASIDGVPMNQFAPDHPATESYRQLARELISRGSLP